MGRIREIERNINKRFTLKQVPNGEEVCEKQLFHLVNEPNQETKEVATRATSTKQRKVPCITRDPRFKFEDY
jgi:hypothetical protein